MNLLHIIPRFIGGGPERHLLALAAAWRSAGLQIRQRILVLDPPASAPLLIRARRLGVELLVAPDLPTIRNAIEAADVVDIKFWNHPRLFSLFRQELPACRRILNCAVAGTTIPHVLTAELGRLAQVLVVSTNASLQTPAVLEARRRGCRVESAPALADMSRLAGLVRREHDGICVGYLGLVEPTKMHPRFAELSIAVRSPEVRFEVYGGGTWREHLQRQFEVAGQSGRIRFHGQVEDIRPAFAGMDIFGYPLAPDTSATSEKTIQEAMWAGIPPVVLAGNGASPLVHHEETGLVCATEAEYPAAIDRLAADPQLRRRLGEAAYAYAREHFDPVRNAARFHDVVQELVALPKRDFTPLPGHYEAGAAQFVQSLGHLGQDFATSLRGETGQDGTTVAVAEVRIRQATAILTQGEGGIVHYRNTHPEDPHLHFWCGLISLEGSNPTVARQEFEAAVALGLARDRILPYLEDPRHAR